VDIKMNLRKTKELLELLDKTFVISPSDYKYQKHHSLFLENDKINLIIHLESQWRSFILSEEDLDKEPQQIVQELQELMRTLIKDEE
jgi:hypothetical protein